MIFTDEIKVNLIQSMGGDHMVVAAAKVSTNGNDALEFALDQYKDSNAGLINYLVKHRHGTPLEHSSLTFFVHAPAFVWWEWVRHRIGFSYNLESSRYKVIEPVFWIPKKSRKLIPAEGFKSARPKFIEATDEQHKEFCDKAKLAYSKSYQLYCELIDAGFAREAARALLPFSIYFSGWVTANPRSLMSFLSLRTHDENAAFVSYPQAEIEEAARIIENVLELGWPITYNSFVKNGRVAP